MDNHKKKNLHRCEDTNNNIIGQHESPTQAPPHHLFGKSYISISAPINYLHS